MMRGQTAAVSDFYTVIPSGPETADVILYPPEGGQYILSGIQNDPGLEADIRERYASYLASAEPILKKRGDLSDADES